jgi:hypothetical protein
MFAYLMILCFAKSTEHVLHFYSNSEIFLFILSTGFNKREIVFFSLKWPKNVKAQNC